MENTLRKALWGFLRPLVQLITNLLSPEKGEEWEREFKLFLRKEPCWVIKLSFKLYLAPGQQNGRQMKGFDLEKHLEETRRINRAFSLEDELVKGWIANPSTYPEEFKGKPVFLWKSKRASGDSYEIAYLIWIDWCVLVFYIGVKGNWHGNNPALLKPAE